MASAFASGTAGAATPFVVALREAGKIVVDLSADFRTTDPAVYTPFVQSDERWKRFMTLAIRTDNSSSGLVKEVKAQVWRVDGQIPVSDVQTMDQRMAVSLAQQRFYMLLLGAFAALALILAGVGIVETARQNLNCKHDDF